MTNTGIVEVVVQGAGTNVQVVIVELNGSSEMGWPVVISPSTLTLKPGASKRASGPFMVTVTVPPGASSKTPDKVTVSGSVIPFPGVFKKILPPTDFIINVEQYFDCILDVDDNPKVIGRGCTAVYDITITNDGNGDDAYNIKLPDSEELNDQGFVLCLQQYCVEVQEGGMENVQVTVSSSHDVKFKTYAITVNVDSSVAAKKGVVHYGKEIDLILKVEEDGGDDLGQPFIEESSDDSVFDDGSSEHTVVEYQEDTTVGQEVTTNGSAATASEDVDDDSYTLKDDSEFTVNGWMILGIIMVLLAVIIVYFFAGKIRMDT